MSGYEARPPLPWFTEVTDPLARFADEARPLLRGVIADVTNYPSGRIVVTFGGARLEVIYPAPPVPVVGQTVEFYRMRVGRSAYLALPQTMAAAAGILARFVVTGSVAQGFFVFDYAPFSAPAPLEVYVEHTMDSRPLHIRISLYRLDGTEDEVYPLSAPLVIPAGTPGGTRYAITGPAAEGYVDYGWFNGLSGFGGTQDPVPDVVRLQTQGYTP